MKTVRTLITNEGRAIGSVTPESTVWEAINLMQEKDIGAVLVFEDDRLVGIFTERDYARKLLLEGLSSLRTKIRVTMTSDLISVTPDETLENCMSYMLKNRIRHLPVLDGDEFIGLITIWDLLETMWTGAKMTAADL